MITYSYQTTTDLSHARATLIRAWPTHVPVVRPVGNGRYGVFCVPGIVVPGPGAPVHVPPVIVLPWCEAIRLANDVRQQCGKVVKA